MARLVEAGFDLDDPSDENVPYTRRVDTTPGAEDVEDSAMHRNGKRDVRALFFKFNQPAGGEPEEQDKALDYAVAVAAKVIDAFDCTKDRLVSLHADCMRLAIGYPCCGSQSDVARRHGVNRANVSFRVRSIQRRLGLGGNVVANSRQRVRNR